MAVLEFKRKESWLGGVARCSVCKHTWAAAEEVGANWLECPECHAEKGLFTHPALPNEDIWECNCGGDVFRVTRNGLFCIHCAKRSNF